ncbi:hypothetical protein N5P37_011529 [Trichoderma harzianum]|uniref:FAD-binding domain-containing protein n=1 Tax=Trichoderma harzianum CBS 226.95 TaxID=983964 RepID=A0A2T3ZT87_TRIHA|nr:hypothetical protein M431DRAFT_488114 [Trichoderma harzianum CBS 226.95]KAK0755976.1 hypothetical protein N5P37_011529 [Trichoderma harzianum]PKK51912.1 hypothetical protein CI102_4526 [Trichoderma harzianum]PTB48014.1 hypothetical protein M431DRAFT_488114 [Trichoderma harzianum CBS 226.95]
MDASQKPHVIIIGSGASGCLIAQGLKKRGISFSIHDVVDPAKRPRNWSMSIYWAFPYFEKLLPKHLYERLQEALVRPHYHATANEKLVISNIQTGDIVKEFTYPYAIRTNRMGIRKLAVEGIDVVYDHELSGIEYTETGVIAHFADGTSEAGTTLVGADGGGSFVRRQLLGPRGEAQSFPDYEMVNMNVRYPLEHAKYIAEHVAGYVDYGVHPKGVFMMLLYCTAPDANDHSTWTFHIALTFPRGLLGKSLEGLSNSERVRLLKTLADDMTEPRRTILKHLPDDQVVPYDPIRYWVPTPWDNHDGRVTLAGDASHAISFHRGQGFNNAVTDCAHFVSAMENVATGKANLVDAINGYEKEVIERGIREVTLSKELTLSIHEWNRFLESPEIKYGGNDLRGLKQANATGEAIVSN